MSERSAFRVVAAAAIAAVSPRAAAQETAQLLVQVEPAILLPGESATVRVYAAYEPHIGAPAVWNTLGGTGQSGTVNSFSLASFNLSAIPIGGVSGSWSNLTLGAGSVQGGSAGALVPGGVNGVLWGTGSGPPLLPILDNPVLLWFATWTADAGTEPGSLDLTTDVLGFHPSYPDTVHLWLQGGTIGGFAVEDAWPCTDGQALITVIPAPGIAALALGGVWLLGRRSRPRRQEQQA